MVAVTKPNLKNIKTSFLDSRSQELIVISDDKIYFIKLKDFVSHATPNKSEEMIFNADSISRLLQAQEGTETQNSDQTKPDGGEKTSEPKNETQTENNNNKGAEEVQQILDQKLEYSEIEEYQKTSYDFHPDFLKAMNGDFSLMIYISTFENEMTSGGEYLPYHVFVFREHVMVIDSLKNSQFYVKLDIKPHLLNRFVLSKNFDLKI